jgi:hypothetical protein
MSSNRMADWRATEFAAAESHFARSRDKTSIIAMEQPREDVTNACRNQERGDGIVLSAANRAAEDVLSLVGRFAIKTLGFASRLMQLPLHLGGRVTG